MEQLPGKILLKMFSYLSHRDVLKSARVCRKWRTIAYDPRNWQLLNLRPEYGGLKVSFQIVIWYNNVDGSIKFFLHKYELF